MGKVEKKLTKGTDKITRAVGSIGSIIFHTLFFIASFGLYFFGIDLNLILMVVTTVVSLEAIYLAIFIQMSVNQHSITLEDVAEDIDEIQEDIDEIQEDVDEIQEDIDGIQGDELKVSTKTTIKIGDREVSEDTIMIALREYFNK